jgi:pilus assembly protein CpaF
MTPPDPPRRPPESRASERSGAEVTRTIDGAGDDAAIVARVCDALADRPGDPAALAADEVRRVAPLRSVEDQEWLTERAVGRLCGLGALEGLLADPRTDEVLVNAGGDVWVDAGGRLEPAGTVLPDRIDHLVERILAPLGRRVDRSSPIVDARLPNGSRVCVALPPVSVAGTTISIRRLPTDVLPLDRFADGPVLTLLGDIVRRRCNVVVSGATSSGKTTLLASMLSTTPPTERLVVVEDTAELPVTGRHAVRLEARPPAVDGPPPIDVSRLVRTALRLRPDRIVVGEVRGEEVLGLVQAMNTGHDGCAATCHANGPDDAVLRLEALVLQAAPAWPLAAVRHHLARSIDVVVHVERVRGSTDRRVEAIHELCVPAVGAPIVTRPLTSVRHGHTGVVEALHRGRT